MAIPTNPATPEQMQLESLKELDRMRNMSLQALAMSRIRDSVRTLSRETGFSEQAIPQFNQLPLYIPEYQRWSRTAGAIVGTAPPQRPTYQRYSQWSPMVWQGAESTADKAIKAGLERQEAAKLSGFKNIPEYSPWVRYLNEYASWSQEQRNLPV